MSEMQKFESIKNITDRFKTTPCILNDHKMCTYSSCSICPIYVQHPAYESFGE
jgi:hypothetical protein